ncbi:uncharacterized protein BP01DRAFT_376809 [Aspergillus saccharolyticus JOP 1030-1]|uniref:Uncharacterized protein n=1 Tax=Aspergillus saccharolyticus JOP 1030-1 TaxID=1450539 RepID=A0A318Z5Y4_9EURO|nr:hypothetical protein BP01DRAFT_376809 [Aspergillus saccharolyticus JOP 1030-1]PYH41777.1 hypothetical protein BP01DRAFT_376809 [Aspergillus saccharolyticus JOP 1030-1]
MHLPSLISTTALAALAAGAIFPRQDETYVGYLLSTFADADPQVFWYLSTLKALNGAVRDVFLTTNAENSEYFLLGTDLNINADGFFWDEATRRGSQDLIIWNFENLVDCIEDATAGITWILSICAPGYIQDGVVYEGPAAFLDIQTAGKYHLLLDNHVEYVPFESTDLTAAERVASNRTGFPTGLKHGNVVRVTKSEYDALVERYGG